MLMLSLGTALLVAGHVSVADDVGTILLPSQGTGTHGTVMHACRERELLSLLQLLAAASSCMKKLIAAWLVEDLQTRW